jgi:ribosome-binding factor A
MSKQGSGRGRRGRAGSSSSSGAQGAADRPFTLAGEGLGGETLGLRAQRLSHILFEELYRLFRLEVNDPRLADVVPTTVELSPDLRSARVLYSLRNPPEQSEAYKTARTPGMARALVHEHVRNVNEGLARVAPFLRARLRDAVSIRYMPDLHFHRDRIAESTLRAVDSLGGTPAPPKPPAAYAGRSEDGEDGGDDVDDDSTVAGAPEGAPDGTHAEGGERRL